MAKKGTLLKGERLIPIFGRATPISINLKIGDFCYLPGAARRPPRGARAGPIPRAAPVPGPPRRVAPQQRRLSAVMGGL